MPDLNRFRKFKTRHKAGRVMVYWQDRLTGHLYVFRPTCG